MFARRFVMALVVSTGLVAAAWAQDKEVEYSSHTESQKAIVKGFAGVPKEVQGPSKIIRLPTGDIDVRTKTERYLQPNHPGVQPRADNSTYTRYLNVPNDTKLPWHLRPVGQEDPKHPFATLPQITPPATLPFTYYISPGGIYPKADPFGNPPGTNFLPTVYQNARDGLEVKMENTLPSTPTEPYHLQEGTPRVTPIDPTSPTEDLRLILDRIYQTFTDQPVRGLWQKLDKDTYEDVFTQVKGHVKKIHDNATFLKYHLQWAIDIIEGNSVPGRAYSCFPLFHHSGQKRIKRVMPVFGKDGQVIGGNAHVHQLWFDQRIESDTMFLDFHGDFDPPHSKLPAIPPEVPWTITYTIDVLNRGADDFATTTMFFDAPEAAAKYFANPSQTPKEAPKQLERAKSAGYRLRSARRQDTPKAQPQAHTPLPHISMDETFFPMDSGTKTVVTIKMPPHKYYNLTYTWGWRVHPPRAQAMENASKQIPIPGKPSKDIVDFEREVFVDDFKNPIDAIGDLAPEKRMWRAFKKALDVVNRDDPNATFTDCLEQLLDARSAYLDWKDRTHLPSGLRPDPKSDLTLFYVNNTIYGELTDGGFTDLPKWRERPTDLRVTLINGDYFDHGYLNIDWGGNRGWENQFKSSIQVAGSGTFFSFGRFHWRMNTNPGTITVSKARGRKGERPIEPGEMPDEVIPGVHRLWIQLNHEPSRRLRFYQFDPAHHDVAIYSIH
jgi:hypothetical protein